MVKRCFWVENQEEIYLKYHDEEWGLPVYDDHLLYEQLILESFSAGLSWLIILKKRENFRKAFDNFDIDKVIAYDEAKVEALMQDKGIVRSRAKILATISNSKIIKDIQKEYGSFSNYLWGYTNHDIIYPDDVTLTKSELSDCIAKDLKKRGMKFCGSVTIFAYLQAVGIVNSHEPSCFRYRK
jgi:3-methyladenine DNA glycosylase